MQPCGQCGGPAPAVPHPETLEEMAREAVIDYNERLDSSIIPGSMRPNAAAIAAMKAALSRALRSMSPQHDAPRPTREMIETIVLRWYEGNPEGAVDELLALFVPEPQATCQNCHGDGMIWTATGNVRCTLCPGPQATTDTAALIESIKRELCSDMRHDVAVTLLRRALVALGDRKP